MQDECEIDNSSTILKSLYQRKVSVYLSSTKNHQYLSRYFALSALDDTYHSYQPPPPPADNKLINSEGAIKDNNDDNSDAVPKREVASNNFICPCCGSLLLPGHNITSCDNTTTSIATTVRVRSLKRGKTRRRRASRLKRKYLEHKELQNNQNSTINKKWKVDNTILNEKCRKEFYNLSRINDGEAKNCVVYTCSICCYKTKYKGRNVSSMTQYKQNMTKNCNTNNVSVHNEHHDTTKGGNNTERMNTTEVMEVKKKGCVFKPNGQFVSSVTHNKFSITSDDDFIPLVASSQQSSLKTKVITTSATAKKRNRIVSSSSKKNTKDKKSKLMDFLSSLND